MATAHAHAQIPAGDHSATTLLGWLFIGGSVGGLIWYSVRAQQAIQAQRNAALAGLSGGSVPTPGSSPMSVNVPPLAGPPARTPSGVLIPPPSSVPGSPPVSPSTPIEVSTTTSWLRQSVRNRRVFLFQAGMYSYLNVNQVPDGKFGPYTQQLVQIINNATGNSMASANWSDAALTRLAPGLKSLTGVEDLSQASAQLLPLSLPGDLINQINLDGLSVAADVPLLQIEAS